MERQFSTHDPRIVHLYEVIGSHFVEVVFNSIYTVAYKAWQDRKYPSITDAYLASLNAYITQLKSDSKSYESSVQRLFQYVKALPDPQFNIMTYTSFIDRFARTLFPEEMFESTRTTDRDEVVGTVLCDLVASLGKYVTSFDMITLVIDSHRRNAETVQMLQNRAVTLLFDSRSTIHNKFLGEATQAKDSASLDHIHRLTKCIRGLVTEKAELEARLEEAEGEAGEAQEKYKNQKKEFKHVLVRWKQQYSELAAKAQQLEQENRGMRAALERRGGGLPTSIPVLPPVVMPGASAPLSSQMFGGDSEPSIDPFALEPMKKGPAMGKRDAPAGDSVPTLGDMFGSSAAASAPAEAPGPPGSTQDAQDNADIMDILDQ